MFFLVVLSITLMVLDTRVAAVSRLRSMLSVALTPIQYLVSEPIQFMGRVRTILVSRDALLKENTELKTQRLLLNAQVQRLLAVESENNQLKALLHSSAQVQGKVLVAQLLAVDADPFIHQVVLDKGSRDGVFVGQPVLDAKGVMGQIVQVSPMTSRVLLINDPHSGVAAQVTRNGLRGIVMGEGYSGKLFLVNIPQTADVKAGDILVTSGLGDRYPQGYPIGVVSSVNNDPAFQFAVITITPSARLDEARQVLLVWPNKQSMPSNAGNNLSEKKNNSVMIKGNIND